MFRKIWAWFHRFRLATWTAQIPIVFVWKPELKHSIGYLVFLSIAALIESAITDVYQAWEKEKTKE